MRHILQMITAVVLLTLSVGCANPKVTAMRQWETWATTEVQEGRMRMSVFFQGEHDHLIGLPPNEISNYFIPIYARAVQVAQLYEMGYISAPQFQQFNNELAGVIYKVKVRIKERRAAAAQAAYQSFVEGIQEWLVLSAALAEQQQREQPKIINCTTSRFGMSLDTTCTQF